MTAEEVALQQFRNAVELARMHREASLVAEHNGNPTEQYAHWRLASNARDVVSMLARIIRAIRRENRGDRMRASYEASVSEQVIHAETAWYDRGYEQGYEQGHRDALRGVQGACLFEIGRLEERQKKYGGSSWDWERCPEDMRAYDVLCEVAEFAEEAAR